MIKKLFALHEWIPPFTWHRILYLSGPHLLTQVSILGEKSLGGRFPKWCLTPLWSLIIKTSTTCWAELNPQPWTHFTQNWSCPKIYTLIHEYANIFVSHLGHWSPYPKWCMAPGTCWCWWIGLGVSRRLQQVSHTVPSKHRCTLILFLIVIPLRIKLWRCSV